MILWLRCKMVAIKSCSAFSHPVFSIVVVLALLQVHILTFPKSIWSFNSFWETGVIILPTARPCCLNLMGVCRDLEMLSGNISRIINNCILLLLRYPLRCSLCNSRLSHWTIRESRCLLLFKIPFCTKCDKEDKHFLQLRPVLREGPQQSNLTGLLL